MEQQPDNSEIVPLYDEEATRRVGLYKEMISDIFENEPDEDTREELLVEAGRWYKENVLEAGYTDEQIMMAHFANS